MHENAPNCTILEKNSLEGMPPIPPSKAYGKNISDPPLAKSWLRPPSC